MQDAARHRDDLIVRAVADSLLPWDEITQAAQVNSADVGRLAAYTEPTPPTFYLSLEGFARRIGVSESTIKSYRCPTPHSAARPDGPSTPPTRTSAPAEAKAPLRPGPRNPGRPGDR